MHIRTYHLVATSYKDGHCPRVRTLLDDEHFITRCAEGDLTDEACLAQLFRSEVLEPGNNASIGGNGNQLRKAVSPRPCQ